MGMIEDRWQIPVRIRDVPDPFTGDLDGAEIRIDFDLDTEDALFILVHLFGHTVQWNVSAEARAIALHRGPWDATALAALRAWELARERDRAFPDSKTYSICSASATYSARPEGGEARVHTSILRLRALGLREHLASSREGYWLTRVALVE